MSSILHQDYFKRTMQQIGDFAFLQDGFSVVSRDFLHAYVRNREISQLWDMRNPSKPLTRQTIYPPIVHHICELYEDDQLQNTFRLRLSGDGNIVTGGFGPYFHQIDLRKVLQRLMQDQNLRYNVLDGSCEKVSKSLEGENFDASTITGLVTCSKTNVAVVHGTRLAYFS